MKKTIFIFGALLFLFTSYLNAQEVFKHQEAGIQFTVPGGWYYETKDADFEFYPPDKDLVIQVSIAEPKDAEGLVKDLISHLEKTYKNIEMGEPKDTESNGLKGWELSGTVKDKDGNVLYVYYLMFATPKGKILEIYEVGYEEVIKKYKKEFDLIDESLKPLE
jgi:hypothetical protein